MSDANLVKFGVAGSLIVSGVVCLYLGFRPKTAKEKQEEHLVFAYAPERRTLATSQRTAIDEAGAALNELRAAIRDRLAKSPAPKLDGYKISSKLAAKTLENADYPWPHIKNGWATVHIDNSAGKYDTDIVSPALQNAVAIADVMMNELGTNLPAQMSSSQLIGALRAYRSAGALEMAAGIAAAAGGLWLRAKAAHNYEAESARAFAAALAQNMPGPDVTKPALAWLALNSGLSDMNSEERQAARELRNSPSRVPRNLKV